MGLLQQLPITKGHWNRIGIYFLTTLPTLDNGHDCIVPLVNHKTKRADWHACKKTIDTVAFARIFINDIISLQGVPQEVESNCNVRFTPDY